MPKVSIIVPVYNTEEYLSRCIESLLNQTLHEIEIILVDDESPDNCPVMCDQYADKYSNVKVIHEKNGGLGIACNSGIEAATGEYIAFCDSDDYVDTAMYETMYDAAQKYDADAVYTGIKTVDPVDQDGLVHPMNEYSSLQLIKGRNDIHSFVMDMIASEPSDPVERHIAMSAKIVLYKKSLIDKCNLRFVSERILITEDLIWNIDFLCHAACVVTLPETFYYYCRNAASLTKRIRTDRFGFYKVLRKELYEKIKYYEMPRNARIRIDRMFIGYCRNYIGCICNSNLALKVKRNTVSEVCNDIVWKEIRCTYPIAKSSIKHQLMFLLILYNCYGLIALLYKIKKLV